MRAGLFLAMLGACGGSHAASIDAAPCGPEILYLDRFGGAYDHGLLDDSTVNHSILVDVLRTLPPWPGDDVHWGALTACIREALRPFAIDITEIDPGTKKHFELVFTTAYWVDSAVTNIVPNGCRGGEYQLEFVFGDALATPTRACEVAMGGFAELAGLLSPADDCLDFTSPARDCGVRFFQNLDMLCVDASDQPAACRCGGTTENTYATLAARFPGCRE